METLAHIAYVVAVLGAAVGLPVLVCLAAIKAHDESDGR